MDGWRRRLPTASTLVWTAGKAATAAGIATSAALRVQHEMKNYKAAVQSIEDEWASRSQDSFYQQYYNPAQMQTMMKSEILQVNTGTAWVNSVLATAATALVLKNSVDAVRRLRASNGPQSTNEQVKDASKARVEQGAPNWPVALVSEGLRATFYVAEIALNNPDPSPIFLVTNAAVLGASVLCGLAGSMGWDRQSNRSPKDRPHLGGLDAFKATTLVTAASSSAYAAIAYLSILPKAIVSKGDEADTQAFQFKSAHLAGSLAATGTALAALAVAGAAVTMWNRNVGDKEANDIEAQPATPPSERSVSTSSASSISEVSSRKRRHSF